MNKLFNVTFESDLQREKILIDKTFSNSIKTERIFEISAHARLYTVRLSSAVVYYI